MDECTNIRTWCVYIHTNKINHKVYVGITSRKPEKRWDSGYGYMGQEYFYRAIKKYGWENFEHIIFANGVSKDEACNMEVCLIALYKSNISDYGYNISSGGDTGYTWTQERKKQMSDRLKGENSYWFGKHLSEDTKNKISLARKGVKASEETRQKMSESRRGKKLSNETKQKLKNARKNYIPTDETKRKIKENHADFSGGNHPRAKPVLCIELNIIYPCVRDAEQSLGINHAHISACCIGNRKSAGKHPETGEKLHWEYVDNTQTQIEL